MVQRRQNGRCCSLCVSSLLFPGAARPEEAAGPEPGWAVGWGGYGDLAVPVSPRPPPAHSRRALLYAHKSLGKHYRSTGDPQGWLRVPRQGPGLVCWAAAVGRRKGGIAREGLGWPCQFLVSRSVREQQPSSPLSCHWASGGISVSSLCCCGTSRVSVQSNSHHGPA